jgi:hypothetical protein
MRMERGKSRVWGAWADFCQSISLSSVLAPRRLCSWCGWRINMNSGVNDLVDGTSPTPNSSSISSRAIKVEDLREMTGSTGRWQSAMIIRSWRTVSTARTNARTCGLMVMRGMMKPRRKVGWKSTEREGGREKRREEETRGGDRTGCTEGEADTANVSSACFASQPPSSSATREAGSGGPAQKEHKDRDDRWGCRNRTGKKGESSSISIRMFRRGGRRLMRQPFKRLGAEHGKAVMR